MKGVLPTKNQTHMALRSGNWKTPINSLYSRKRYRSYMKAILVVNSAPMWKSENRGVSVMHL